MRRVVLVPVLVTFIAPWLAAEEQPTVNVAPTETVPKQEETVIVTADRRETAEERSTASVAAVDSNDIRERGYVLNTWNWLEGLAGVDAVAGNGGIDGGIGRVRIRGANSYDTQWQVDGIPVSDPSTPQGNLSPVQLPTAGLERLELVRGPQSGLYGSRAAGGVVNLITARPTQQHELFARGEAGSFGTVRGSAQGTGPLGNALGYALAVDGLHSDGFSARTNDAKGDANDHEADALDRLSVTGRIEWQAHESTRLYVASNFLAYNQEFDSFGAPDDDIPLSKVRNLMASTGTRSQFGKQLTIESDISWMGSDRWYHDNGFFGVTTTEYTGDQYRGALRGRYELQTWIELAAGIDGAREQVEIDDGTTTDKQHDSLGGGWAQAYSAGEHHDLSLSLRHDLHSRAGDATTWRVAAAAHAFEQRATLRAAVATSFRAPSLSEQFAPFGGNPDLEAQESLGWEVGVRLRPLPVIALESTWFVNDYDNVIGYSNTTNAFANVPEYRVHGLENTLELTLIDRHLSLVGVYTWQEVVEVPKDTFDSFSPFQPEHLATISAVGRIDRGWASVGFTRRGAAPTTSSGVETSWASVLDAAVGIYIARTWEISARVENCLDEDYVISPGFTTSGLAAYGGVAARF